MPAYPIPVDRDSPFPIQNIPLGIFSTKTNPTPRAATVLGDWVLDLALLEHEQVLDSVLPASAGVFSQPSLNDFAALGKDARRTVRETIIGMLQDPESTLFSNVNLNFRAFHRLENVTMHLPMHIAAFTDFSCFEEHVSNCFTLSNFNFGPENNFFKSPMAYNGRASSILPSGACFPRPQGVFKDPRTGSVGYQSTRKLDYEMELGIFLSNNLPHGQLLDADTAGDYIFGFVLLNDWSARDIQAYESMPAGPFNCKAFATHISPWVIVPEALECVGQRPAHVSASNYKHSYFTPAQCIAHRASSGCGLQTGELLGGGTISSPESEWPDHSVARSGCLFEITWDGTREVPQTGGTYLNDFDSVTMEAWATGADNVRIGFGKLVGTVAPAVTDHC
ncbi:putative 2-hydroxyhepta-2,4-diene-1,7-dioate isomerase [Aspergillus carlsbadensis]|nr:putative 2-hydroxyhepta-2,4-diene-1,7-dioate isomerase [Aspergillus carlsbadensis]